MRINDTQLGTSPLVCQCEYMRRVASQYEQQIQWLTEQLRGKDEQIRAQNEQLLAQEKRLMAQCKQISILIKQLAKELDAKTRQVYMLIERFPRPAVPTAESLRMKNRKKAVS